MAEVNSYSAKRHPKVSPNRDGYINVGGYFEVSPTSALALAAELLRAVEVQGSAFPPTLDHQWCAKPPHHLRSR